MVIESIPNIFLDGGAIHPYSFDYNYGGSDVSEITLKFINKNGEYNVPENTSKTSSKIQIGSFYSFDAFPVENIIRDDSQGGSEVTIKFHDSSIILDKFVIGLKGIHGPGFSTTPIGAFQNIILVGSQLDPCEEMGNNPIDPCAPICAERNNERETFDCAKEKLLKILQIDYSFNELRQALAGKIAFGDFPTGINNDYRTSYTGSLREVLQNWCSDFALGFYWENNAVYFYDLSVGIPYKDPFGVSGENNVVSRTKTKSIAGNSAKAKVVYFGAEGEEREYSCTANSSKILSAKAITLRDLIDDDFSGSSPGDLFIRNNYDPHTKNYTNGFLNLQDAIIMSYYSSDVLRDLYFFYEREGLIDAAAVEAWIASNKKKIPALGDFKPIKVAHSKSLDSSMVTFWKNLKDKMSPDESALVEKKGGYFIIAQYDETKHQKLSEMEKSLAEDFLGRYWIRYFGDGTRYTFEAPDANVTYYPSGSEIIFPFLDDLPNDLKKSSDFLQKLIKEAEGDTAILDRGKFILVDRTPVWSPSRASDEIEKLLKTVAPFKIVNLGSEDAGGANQVGSSAVDEYSLQETVFLVYPKPKKLDLGIRDNSDEERNPLDVKNMNKPVELDGNTVTYGLQDALSRRYRILAPGSDIKIHIPSQSGPRFGSDYGGYEVLANGTNFTNDIKVILPKKEVVLGDSVSAGGKDVATELVFKDATQVLVKFLESSGTDSCGYSDAQIAALLLRYNSRLKTFPSVEREVIEYEISGIPQIRLNAKDGLQSFTINTSRGLRTNLSIGNLPVKNKSEAVEERRFEEIAAILGKSKNYFRK